MELFPRTEKSFHFKTKVYPRKTNIEPLSGLYTPSGSFIVVFGRVGDTHFLRGMCWVYFEKYRFASFFLRGVMIRVMIP